MTLLWYLLCSANSFGFYLFGVYYISVMVFHRCEHWVKMLLLVLYLLNSLTMLLNRNFSGFVTNCLPNCFKSRIFLNLTPYIFDCFIRNCNMTKAFVSRRDSTQYSQRTRSKYWQNLLSLAWNDWHLNVNKFGLI